MDTTRTHGWMGVALGAALAGLAGCASAPHSEAAALFNGERVTEHRGADDLLTGGLGLDGLRGTAAPAFADPANPTDAEVRRRALWNNWRGIADLGPLGNYGTLYGSTANVPGREFSADARIPGAKQPHRVLVQVPDAFDQAKRCVVVSASSGSRGIYGAIAVAGAWGLPKGCAVAYTDKGAGTDYIDHGAAGVEVKHAHSQDNPEADWGRHVVQAAEFALHALTEAFPDQAPFRADNTRVIAVGISNGGGAVLRAAELPGDLIDAVVAGEPNVDVPGGRSLYDYTTEAAVLMPCALSDVEGLAQSPLSAMGRAMGAARCASLGLTGEAARAKLHAAGWTDAAMHAAALSVDFDLYRAVAVTYASAYGRYAFGQHPCGFNFAAQNKDFTPRAATPAEIAAWRSDASGIPPGAGVGIIDTRMAAPDFTRPGIECLRELWTGQGADADRVRKGVAEVRASAPRKGLPVIVVHGMDDGLIPPAFSSAPYVAMAKAAGRDVRYWQVRNAQHFDGFLALPEYGARYVPLLPYVYAALDRVAAHLDDASNALPADAVVETKARGGEALTATNLAIPR
ncbi:D-(-)-3-hydroxybutyrate oligomer hydrolase [Lysobacter helvus]|uniref:D-(-)-3-hydroxybutyrate oligomer hydrolase n=2 Tax=Lysobacteraceae TaxID=32033 RepID=A0ABM7Q7S8_9GAMM|nr:MULTISPECIES: 3-hydroxybutyrate oligomer hydrolase family protein [Lysobacter]BCT93472.1 D-(-)-3-hydroxybutyrate oligomer hydrolase [Lysobacter caseinilyticus]BCT96625.1 D-(-)-3-hydroxybutyrate oligomer hydrolase [Lysobacter helvus]